MPLLRRFNRVFLTDEANVLVGEIEAGFHVGEQVQQIVAQLVQRLGHAAPPTGGARLLQSSARLPASITPSTASARVRSSLPARNARIVNSPGCRVSLAAPAFNNSAISSSSSGGAGERVQLGDVLTGVAVRSGPEIQVGR